VDEVITYKKDWGLTPEAFNKLLDWLDADRERAGQRYEELRRKLVSYFDRRKCLGSDDLTDETINRVARRITEDENILKEEPLKYCYGRAREVFLEYLRHPSRTQRTQSDVNDLPQAQQPAIDPQTEADLYTEKCAQEQQEECLAECLGKLPPETRKLILQYYKGEQRAKINNRRALAEQLGISLNALRIRASRLRDELEACVTECVGRHAK
jgi:RNA polymerase sigma factor (sigma-70 family)